MRTRAQLAAVYNVNTGDRGDHGEQCEHGGRALYWHSHRPSAKRNVKTTEVSKSLYLIHRLRLKYKVYKFVHTMQTINQLTLARSITALADPLVAR